MQAALEPNFQASEISASQSFPHLGEGLMERALAEQQD